MFHPAQISVDQALSVIVILAKRMCEIQKVVLLRTHLNIFLGDAQFVPVFLLSEIT